MPKTTKNTIQRKTATPREVPKSPATNLVGLAITFLQEAADPTRTFATSEFMVPAFARIAKENGIVGSLPAAKRCAEMFDPREFHEIETMIESLMVDVPEEDVQFFRKMLDRYAAHVSFQALLYGLWAGASVVSEAVGLPVAPINAAALNWTVARNVARIGLERGPR